MMIWIAAIVLLLALSPLAVVLLIWLRSELTLKQAAMWTINYVIAKLMWRTKLEGPMPVKPGQGAVIVANHRCGVDPCFIQVAVRRVIYWMVAREYVEAKFIGSILRALQVIPVGRGGVDTAATKLAIR